MSNIIGYSKGLYSSWFYYAPTRSLFDCGEGCASTLGNRVYAVENIFISHGHIDHIAGLLNFVGIRQLGRGDRDKPLTIYYPSDDLNVLRFKQLIEATYNRLSFKLVWVPVLKGQTLYNENKKKIETFETFHTRNTSLGYRVVTERKRLKEEYRDKDIKQVIASGVDRNSISEKFKAIEFAYTLDAYKVLPSDIFGADLVVVDATFINTEDRNKLTHMTLVEASALADEAEVKKVIFAHFSPRYNFQDIADKVNKLVKWGFCTSYEIVAPNRVFKL